jgi:hypothetical protein
MYTGRERAAINRKYFNAYLRKPSLVAAGLIPKPKPGQKYGRVAGASFTRCVMRSPSALLAEGVDIRALANYLGHADPGSRCGCTAT